MDAQWWLVWLGAALIAGMIEIFTLSLVFAMVAGGALAAVVVAGLTGSVTVSTLAFAGATALLLLLVRPPLLRYAQQGTAAAVTGVAALVGRSAEVVEPVTGRGGQVKLAGEIWSARTQTPGETLEIGSTVYVIRIDGATVVVMPLPPDSASPGRVAPPSEHPPRLRGDFPSDRSES
jgi:membrane protein implicated in regulation of membrane protease activity